MITFETLKSFCADNDVLRPAITYACLREDGWWATDCKKIICVPLDECQQGDMRFACDEFPEGVGKYPKVESVVDVKGFVPEFTVSVDAINDAIAQLPLTFELKEVEERIEFIECPECDGSGEVEISDTVYYNGSGYDVEADVECPICHGYGKIPDIDDYDPSEDDYDPKSDNIQTHTVTVRTGKKIPDFDTRLSHLPGVGYFKAKYAKDLLRVASEQGVTDIECKGGGYTQCALFRLHGVIVGIMPTVNADKRIEYIDVEIKEIG